MKLINADELELDTEWSDYYDGFVSYSQSQINEAEEVKAIPLEKVKQVIEAQEKWLTEAGYNAYNVGIAFGSIKRALGK
jgi:hypothetical protein